MNRRPTQAEVQEQALRAARGPVKVAAPAWVLSYDRATQTATIQVATAYQVQDETGARVARARPPIPNVPVQWGGSVTWDLTEGEWGLAIFADRALDEWKATGSQSVEPRDPRRFDVTDAIFLPGVLPPADPLPAAAFSTGAVVLWDRGTGTVKLGDSTATDFVALASLVLSRLQTIEAAFNLHVHGGVAFGGVSTTPPAPMPPMTSVAATKVKAV